MEYLDLLQSSDPVRVAEGIRTLADTPSHLAPIQEVETALADLSDDKYLSVLDNLLNDMYKTSLTGWIPETVLRGTRARNLLVTDLYRVEQILRVVLNNLSLRSKPLIPVFIPPWHWEIQLVNLVVSVLERVPSDTPHLPKVLGLFIELLGDNYDCYAKLIPRAVSIISRLDLSRLAKLLEHWEQHLTPLSQQATILLDLFPQAPEVTARFLELLASANRPRPSETWLDEWHQVKSTLPHGDLHDIVFSLARVYTPKRLAEWRLHSDPPHFVKLQDEVSRNVARGALWALSDFPDAKTRDFLTQTILSWSKSGEGHPPLGNAAIWALAYRADAETVATLENLYTTVNHKSLQKTIESVIGQSLAEEVRARIT